MEIGLLYGSTSDSTKPSTASPPTPPATPASRYLIGRQFVYRRVLVGTYYRVIFTIDEDARRVEVIRVDSQLSDPATLDDLP